MTRPTAVAAPPAEPFEDLFEVIDQMTMRELSDFLVRMHKRYGGGTGPYVRMVDSSINVDMAATDWRWDAWIRRLYDLGGFPS